MAWREVEKARQAPAPRAQLSLGPYREAAAKTIAPAALSRSWRSSTPAGLRGFLLLFTALWNFATFGFLTTSRAFSPVAIIPPLTGLVVGYVTLALWINRTSISVGARTITIRRGPLPWARRLVEIPFSKLEQLYVEEYVGHEQNERPVTAYRVMARTRDGESIRIDDGMYTYEHAVALERWLEDRLGIDDAPVPGEVQRP